MILDLILRVLSDFRARLVQGEAEQLLLDALLELCKGQGWLKARGRQRTDSTHILAKVRAINRLMCVGETLRFALNSLAIVAGDWLLEHSQEEWLYRYGHRIEEKQFPKDAASRVAVAETMGRDGWALLSAIFAPTAPAFLREIPAVEVLRRVWVQNYRYEDGQRALARTGEHSASQPLYQFALRSAGALWQEIQHAVDGI